MNAHAPAGVPFSEGAHGELAQPSPRPETREHAQHREERQRTDTARHRAEQHPGVSDMLPRRLRMRRQTHQRNTRVAPSRANRWRTKTC